MPSLSLLACEHWCAGSTWLYTFIESVTGILGGSVYNETATEIFFGGSETASGIFLLQRTKSQPRTPR